MFPTAFSYFYIRTCVVCAIDVTSTSTDIFLVNNVFHRVIRTSLGRSVSECLRKPIATRQGVPYPLSSPRLWIHIYWSSLIRGKLLACKEASGHFLMPPTLKKLKGHIALGLSGRAPIRNLINNLERL